MKLWFTSFILLTSTSTQAETLRVMALSATVSEAKINGSSWDMKGGPPDLRLILTIDGREVARCSTKDQIDVRCATDAVIDPSATSHLQLTVADVDIKDDDPAGTATAVGPIQAGTLTLKPQGALQKASVKRAASPADTSAAKSLTGNNGSNDTSTSPTASNVWLNRLAGRVGAATTRDSNNKSGSRPLSPDWLSILIGLVSGALVGYLLLRWIRVSPVRVLLGRISAYSGIGLAAGMVFNLLSPSPTLFIAQWALAPSPYASAP